MKLFCKEGDSRKNIMMLCLLAVLIMEFLFITLESQFSYLGYYLTEDYLIVPALLFLGCGLGGHLSGFAKRRVFLASIAISWFTLAQIIHKLSGMDTHPIATVFFVYLMAFPFASVSEDRENAGIKWIGSMFLAASLVLVGYTGLLLMGMVPESLRQFIFWDGARLHVFWHPNMSASVFMIGIGFAAVFWVQSRRTLVKVLLAAAVAVLFAAMALTNCRTTLLLTGAFLGGILFLGIFKGGWKRFAIGLLAAMLVFVVSFKVSGVIFDWNNSRLVAEIYAQQEAANQMEDPAQKWEETQGLSVAGSSSQSVAVQNEEVILQGDNPQGSLMNDMRTLNGRTFIWKSAFQAIRDNKMLALFGTEYSGIAISVYSPFEVVHGHNSWVEAQMRLGLPGFVLSLVFTALAVWSAAKLVLNPATEIWKKIIAMLTMCVMATGFLEPYLFITNVYYHVTDFVFFFLTGYLDHWANAEN